MKSFLKVCGIEQDNLNCQAEFMFSFQRKEDGTFKPIDIACGYETVNNTLYLRIGFLDFKKVYIYKLHYANDLDWANFKISFNLNKVMNKLDPSKDYDKINICLFTCWCPTKECSSNPEFCDLNVEQIAILYPNENNKC